MRASGVPKLLDRRFWFSVVLASASVMLAVVTCGAFANAEVSAGELTDRRMCGTVLDPNAETSACATALRERAWKAAGLLGVALFGAVGATVLAGSDPPRRRRLLAVTAATSGAVAIVGALLWGGVIDRTVGA